MNTSPSILWQRRRASGGSHTSKGVVGEVVMWTGQYSHGWEGIWKYVVFIHGMDNVFLGEKL